MKNYNFAFLYNGEILTTATFRGDKRDQAKEFAYMYKRRELKKNYPFVKLNRVKVI